MLYIHISHTPKYTHMQTAPTHMLPMDRRHEQLGDKCLAQGQLGSVLEQLCPGGELAPLEQHAVLGTDLNQQTSGFQAKS